MFDEIYKCRGGPPANSTCRPANSFILLGNTGNSVGNSNGIGLDTIACTSVSTLQSIQEQQQHMVHALAMKDRYKGTRPLILRVLADRPPPMRCLSMPGLASRKPTITYSDNMLQSSIDQQNSSPDRPFAVASFSIRSSNGWQSPARDS